MCLIAAANPKGKWPNFGFTKGSVNSQRSTFWRMSATEILLRNISIAYPWINVGGNKGNIDYLDYFGIYEIGNPAMYIINSRHEIILNRRIDMKAIPQFLEEYEKIDMERHK